MKRRDRVTDRLSRLEGQMELLLEQSGNAIAQPDGVQIAGAQVESVAKLVAALLGTVAGSTAIFYAVGYVIVNSHLLTYNVRMFELTHPGYLTAGVLFVLFHILLFVVPIAIVLGVTARALGFPISHDFTNSNRAIFGLVVELSMLSVLSALLGFFLYALMIQSLVDEIHAITELLSIRRPFFVHLLVVLPQLVILTSVSYRLHFGRPDHAYDRSLFRAQAWMFALVLAVPLALFTLSVWSTHIYPLIVLAGENLSGFNLC